MKVGYVGLGVMGGAIARRLMLSRELQVFDLSENRVADFVANGATAAARLAEMARDCDVVMLCLPRSANVRAAIFAPGGLAEGLSPGKIVVDQTSGDPNDTRSMAGELAKRGVAMLDAPVSGGARGAASGTIAIMAGGTEEDYRRVAPVFDQIGPNHTYCGAIGAGQVLKLLNNTISTCNRFALLEAVAVGVKNGNSMDVMVDVLNAGGARSKSSETMLPALAKGVPNAKFALSLMLKDLNLAAQLAIDSGAPLQFGQLARGMLQAASNSFGPDANIDDIADLVADQAGIRFTPE
ncbi:NAD(P)-dependent oxidoreductase [Sinirhodobacter sp. WL0062]|uniref:NAD(P)-dependent oxidoreductase n=1 Tax=Rhodobacter flavimaris TaxID=2907145 RepID=A0ABS8Z1B4_9RHOB|nr:NAD(P)-dependent oxidoreductase [Sinirhodobacter sp. WL0062]MCE5975210.1 NAD(P)-dependent oxidoreductase [Sinirhodobacter sp. WL0062]